MKLIKHKIYLDHASTTKPYPEVIKDMVNILKMNYGNPSSAHSLGQESKCLIENARNKISNLIGAESSEIIFTSSGTESNNFIIRSCIEHLNIRMIITTKIEHKSILETILNLNKQYCDLKIFFLPINQYGEYSLDVLENILYKAKSKKKLVTLMHANNEIGNLINLYKIGNICMKYNALFHSDTVQTIGHLPIKLKDLPIHFISASAHKFHGPKGIGLIYIKKTIQLGPIFYGGEQEKKLRSGTENIYGIIGMQKALEISLKKYDKNRLIIEKLKSYSIKKFKNFFPKIKFGGKSDCFSSSLYTILSVILPINIEYLAFKLDLKGILISQASACNSNDINQSIVIKELFKEKKSYYTPIRISFSVENTTNDIDYLVKVIKNYTC